MSQATDTPPEWGDGAAGYGRRLASGYGRSVISRTIALGVASIDREDSRFSPSNESGILGDVPGMRSWEPLSLVANDGGQLPASRLLGVYSAAFIANYWEPPSQDNTSHALERGSTALLSSVGWHVFEEFWPDIRGVFHRKRNLRGCRFDRGLGDSSGIRECLKEDVMLYYALVFLIIALVAGMLGFGFVAFAAAGIAKICFFIFLILFIASLIAHMGRSRTI